MCVSYASLESNVSLHFFCPFYTLKRSITLHPERSAMLTSVAIRPDLIWEQSNATLKGQMGAREPSERFWAYRNATLISVGLSLNVPLLFDPA